MDEGHIIAEQAHLSHDMRRENDGFPVVFAHTYQLDDILGRDHIEAYCGLIKYDDIWIVDDGAHDGYLLTHSGREFAYTPTGKTMHIQERKQFVLAFLIF